MGAKEENAMDDRRGKAQAVETVYAGVRFRSRIEARYAFLFDELGLRWEYEAEAFELGGKVGRYLPDFWLPDLGYWFEVKPDTGFDPDRLIPILRPSYLLARESQRTVVVSFGVPWFYEQPVAVAYFADPASRTRVRMSGELNWSDCLACGTIALSDGSPDLPAPCGHTAFGSTARLETALNRAHGYRFWEGG